MNLDGRLSVFKVVALVVGCSREFSWLSCRYKPSTKDIGDRRTNNKPACFSAKYFRNAFVEKLPCDGVNSSLKSFGVSDKGRNVFKGDTFNRIVGNVDDKVEMLKEIIF